MLKEQTRVSIKVTKPKAASRIILGIILYLYGLWLLSGFFSPLLQESLIAAKSRYGFLNFLLIDPFRSPPISLVALFMGTIYLFAGVNILTLKERLHTAALDLLFSIWVFIIVCVLVFIKQRFVPELDRGGLLAEMENIFILIRLSLPAFIFVPLLTFTDGTGQ